MDSLSINTLTHIFECLLFLIAILILRVLLDFAKKKSENTDKWTFKKIVIFILYICITILVGLFVASFSNQINPYMEEQFEQAIEGRIHKFIPYKGFAVSELVKNAMKEKEFRKYDFCICRISKQYSENRKILMDDDFEYNMNILKHADINYGVYISIHGDTTSKEIKNIVTMSLKELKELQCYPKLPVFIAVDSSDKKIKKQTLKGIFDACKQIESERYTPGIAVSGKCLNKVEKFKEFDYPVWVLASENLYQQFKNEKSNDWKYNNTDYWSTESIANDQGDDREGIKMYCNMPD